ncbi:hypothetical protein EG327_007740 [Venturia inaequalis]|nr:hypothetical protein EG327_007740 [Venturia inaequalis]
MSDQIDNSGASFNGPASNQAVSNSKLRKRTKTGCLTCRKRRIKCGEERPSCNNCFKSKRHCEGYNQRVIFKAPLGDWPGGHHDSPLGTLQYHNGMLPPSIAQYRPVPPPIITHHGPFTPLQPRPGQTVAYDDHGHPIQFAPPSAGVQYAFDSNRLPLASPHTPIPPAWTPITPQYPGGMFAQQSPMLPTGHGLPTPTQPSFSLSPNADPTWQRPHYANASHDLPTPASSTQQDYKTSPPEPPLLPTPGSSTTQSQDGDGLQLPLRQTDGPPIWWDPTSTHYSPQLSATNIPYSQPTSNELSWTRPYAEPVMHNPQNDTIPSQPNAYTPPPAPIPQPAALYGPSYVQNANDLLEEAAVENMDDDYYDVQSDEEMDISPGETVAELQATQRDFGIIIDLHRTNISDLSMRRYDAFIYAGILNQYHAEWVANPLRNPKTARVFAHFIFATGPTLSIYERKSSNASSVFSEYPVRSQQQGLWTYNLPMMALNHQGLLHAMLALSSLHIAKLQNASVTPSYKHYAFAIKRIHHCVGNPKKKLLPTTLAATLLLGFYEVMTADHLKWSSHLAGAKQLIVEIPFRRITREMRRKRAEQAAREDEWGLHFPDQALQARNPNLTFKDLTPAIDEHLVSTLIGRKIDYDDFGHVIDDSARPQENNLPEDLDLTKYEMYQDLFWCLDFTRWSDCPPRASMGRPDAVYGTHDHLFILLGRIADFAARDRPRKVKWVEANGGQWRPHPGMAMPAMPPRQAGPGSSPQGPPQASPQAPPQFMQQRSPSQLIQQGGPPLFSQQGGPSQGPPRGPPPAMPTFYGMSPMPATPRMPISYQTQGYISTPSPQSDKGDYDLTAATQLAVEEWMHIKSSLNIFRSHFGPLYQPLNAGEFPPIQTPFGPAIIYRSHDIANLWALYYMAYIIALRSHPHMPPAAMMAAGIQAHQTAEFAQTIGQIAGGIVPPTFGQELNPGLGAALCEVSMPLFFAGVQYQDAAQRHWLVSNLRNIEARTGWASVGMIAQGCETSWVKAFEAGRGAPWERTKDEWHMDRRSSTKDSRLSRQSPSTAGDGGPLEDADLTDRRWASKNPATRVHWALGLLSVEEDEGVGSP